jgi:hypothetical protein
MTIRLIEGFDYYPSITGTAGVQTNWTFDSTASVGLIAGRFGGQPTFPECVSFLT